MDFRTFSNPSGRVLRVPQGYEAFVPAPLPRELDVSSLVPLLSQADRSLGELMGLARMLPNPQLLISPLVQRESVLSSQIEGTQADLADLAMFEAGGNAVMPPHSDVIEVRNYRRALDHGIQRLDSGFPLTLRLVRNMHGVLLDGAIGQERTPGEFRGEQNWIGPAGCSLAAATYVPPPVSELVALLGDWERFIHEEAPLPVLVKAAMLHYQFEAIHPFLDGNGRVGRLFLIVYLISVGYVSSPVLYLSPYFARHRDEYYARLRAVTEQSDWEGWLRFFIRGVATQSREGLQRADDLVELQRTFREALYRAPASALHLVDLLFVSPAVTIGQAAKAMGVTWVTANAAIKQLVREGILEEQTGQRRDRVFLAREIVDCINQEIKEPTPALL